MSLDTLADFLEPVNLYMLSNDEGYLETQLGSHIALYQDEFPDIAGADIVLVGCNEFRGQTMNATGLSAPDAIRSRFYALYHWHKDVQVADVGNVKAGASLQDTYAALQSVVAELVEQGKKVVVLGGSHDVTLGQYQAYGSLGKIIEVACVDARIDIDINSVFPAEQFLMQLLTGEPNYTRHYSHIGFQSYMVHPYMLETIHKLGFDCFRVGRVKENMEEMEPVIRNSHMLTFDIAAIQHAHAPSNKLTPNGFTGEEACMLMQYAGMSQNMSSIGIYGYQPADDVHDLTAKQISHMLWYLMDGVHSSKYESALTDNGNFNEFHLSFAEVETVFLQSKRTGRWWMQMPDGKFLACSKSDYITASANDIPERWMRAIERS
jgi:arginase family enzyme